MDKIAIPPRFYNGQLTIAVILNQPPPIGGRLYSIYAKSNKKNIKIFLKKLLTIIFHCCIIALVP